MIRQQPALWRQRFLVSIAGALLAGSAANDSANATPIAPGGAMVTVATATRLGPNDVIVGTMPEATRLHVIVSLNLRNRAQLDDYVARVTNLKIPMAQRRMPRAQFTADYAPTAAQADAVAQYLRASGFSNVSIAANRLLVSAYGNADVVQNAFRTTLAQVHAASGETAYANTASVQIPVSLQGTVQTVLGLQNVHHPRTFERYAKTNTVTGHNPVEFPHIYGGDSLPTASTVTVAIITAGDMTQTLADLTTFTTNNGLPAVNTEVVTVGNGSNYTDATNEWNLDSQTIIGMTGGVQKLMFYAADSMSFADLTLAMNAAITDTTNNPRVVNMSFGACEFNGGAAAAENQVFQSAVALGITFAASSGDDGANCQGGTFGVSDPASSPHVVAVGGTRLDTSGGDYVSESAWSGGGGGLSTFQPKPAWQDTVTGTFRGVPDIAFDGDPSSGARVYFNGSLQQIGGTSLSAPIFVGAWARVLAANPGLTFAAPYFYQTLTAGDYNDVTTGSNATAQSGGLYPAGPGFDQTTGFGSLKLAQVSADLGTPGAPSVTQSFSPTSIALTGTSTLTINLSNLSQPDDAAVLSADFTDTLPNGLTIAATPNASTNCVGAVTTDTASITLSSGSSIPAKTACTITVDVSPVGTGTYTNTIPAGALQTSLGNNAYPATATLVVGNGLQDPVASIMPGTLAFTLLGNDSASKSLTVANTGGGTLSYSFTEAHASAQPLDSVNYQWDDGTSEDKDALTDGSREYEAIWLNRFPVSGPVTINTISIFWPIQATSTLIGKQANLIAYYDADGDGDPSNAVRLGADNLVSISQVGTSESYTVNLQVAGAGDLYIGFADAWAAGGVRPSLQPAALDTTSPHDHSYIVYNDSGAQPDLDDLSQNNSTELLNANLMIRATGTTSYSNTSCDSPSDISWLSEIPANGSVIGGYSQSVTVTADSTNLDGGSYSALLCATTNDAAHSRIKIPVTLTISASNVPPTAGFTVNTSGLIASFTDTSSDSDGSISGWSWDFGDGSPASNAQNPAHTYAIAGTYSVGLTVTDNDNSQNTVSQSVTVSNPPTTPWIAVDFTPASIVVDANATLTITFTNPKSIPAKLTAAFSDDLPTGLTAVTNTLATTCFTHSAPRQARARFILGKDSVIPANGSCTMTGNVTSAAVGIYVDNVAAGDLRTNRGDNAAPATATLQVTAPPPSEPEAVVTPNALSFSVLAGGGDSGTLNIANPGAADLTWSIAEAAPQIRLGSTLMHQGTPTSVALTARAMASRQEAFPVSTAVATAPLAAPSDLSFVLEHGVNEAQLGLTNQSGTIAYAAIYLNRFTPPASTPAYTIDSISILWPRQSPAQPDALIGQQARLVAYYDADADGDPSNATYLGQSPVTIGNIDTFATYPVSFDVPGDGDIYVGFEDAWAEPGYAPPTYPAAEGTSYTSMQGSYLYGMSDGSAPSLANLADNTTGGTLDSIDLPGNLLIRATGNLQGGPTASCSNPSLVPWLSAAATSGTVAASGNTDVTVSVDATGMTPGTYSALLCITTNDPDHAMVEVPVGMTVSACDGVTDRIFADGFDGNTCSAP